MNICIAPSILAADFGKLVDEVAEVVDGGADWIHIDVMDGHFVPNLSMGPLVVDVLRKNFSCHLDVHLMVSQPENWTSMFIASGADTVSVHAEATVHLHRLLTSIQAEGAKAGVALNPATSLHVIEEVVSVLDMLLLMSVNPGFGGQSFIPETLEKIARARVLLDDRCRTDVPIEVDGGVSLKNINQLARAGGSVFVAGSSVFGAPNSGVAVAALRETAMEGDVDS